MRRWVSPRCVLEIVPAHADLLPRKGQKMSLATKELAVESHLQPRMVELMMQSVAILPDVGDLLRRPRWQAGSACRDEDMNGFFPQGTGISSEIQRLCAGCSVSAECLSFALADPSLKGVWAGTSERGRGRMRAAIRQATKDALPESA